MDKTRTMVHCECGSEAIQITKWADESEVYMSWWTRGHGGNMPIWRFQLQHIWHIIRKGTPYSDDIVLSQDETKTLIVALQDAVEK